MRDPPSVALSRALRDGAPGGRPDQDAAITATVHISLMIAVEDAPAASAWYQRALGASVPWSLGGVVRLEIEGAPFFLHEPTRWLREPGLDRPHHRARGGVRR